MTPDPRALLQRLREVWEQIGRGSAVYNQQERMVFLYCAKELAKVDALLVAGGGLPDLPTPGLYRCLRCGQDLMDYRDHLCPGTP